MKPLKASIDVGLVVADLPAMRSFYEGTLGMEVGAERTTGWGEMVELNFGEGCLRLLRPPEPPAPAPIRDIRIAMFRDPEGNVVELLAR